MAFKTGGLLAAAACCLMLAGPAWAGSSYNESTDGDLSGNHLLPTGLTFSRGANVVTGAVGKSTDADRDYFSFTITGSERLAAVVLLSFTEGKKGFLGLEAGSQITADPGAPSQTALLGYVHLVPSQVGTDILPAIGAGAGAIGFTGTLGAGTYSVWLQDTTLGTTNYSLSFLVVPEPASGAMVLGALAGLLATRRRRG